MTNRWKQATADMRAKAKRVQRLAGAAVTKSDQELIQEHLADHGVMRCAPSAGLPEARKRWRTQHGVTVTSS